jgi:hypothetical protein
MVKCPKCKTRVEKVGYCNPCKRQYHAAWVEKNRERVKELKRDWYEKNPLRHSAREKYRGALRSGLLVRQPCEVCGDEKVDGHHDDYTKPLEVRWLCRKHHLEYHRMIRLEKGVAVYPPPIKKPKSESKYPFAKMEVGDSFYVEGDERLCAVVRTLAHRFARGSEIKFVTRRDENGVRVWRVS